jgi:hypothetical protein
MTGRTLQLGDGKDGQYLPDSNNGNAVYVTSNDDDDDVYDDETYLLHVLGSGSRTLMNVNIAMDLGESSIFVNNVAVFKPEQRCQQHNDDDSSSGKKSDSSSTTTTASTTPISSILSTNHGFD